MSQDDLDELKARLSRLESRFDAMALSLEKLSAAPAANTVSPVNFDSGIHLPPANQTARPKPAPAGNRRDYQDEIIRRDQKKTSPGQSRPLKIEAGQMLGIIGAVCIVLSSIFFINLGIAKGVITAPIQLFGMIAAGALSIGLASFLRKRDERYFSILGGVGIAILFIAAYGSFGILDLLSSQEALFFSLAISLLGIYLSDHFKQRFFGIISCFGTLLGPIFLKLTDPYTLAAFYAIWSLLFAIHARRLKAVEILILSVGLSLLSTLTQTAIQSASASWFWPLAFILPQLLIFILTATSFDWQLSDRHREGAEASLAVIAILFFTQQRLYLPNAETSSLIWSLGTIALLGAAYYLPGPYRSHFSKLRFFIFAFIVSSYFYDLYRPYPKAQEFIILPALFLGYAMYQKRLAAPLGIMTFALSGLLFLIHCLKFLFNLDPSEGLHSITVLVIYSLLVYAVAYQNRGKKGAREVLYLGHFLFMRTLLELSVNRVIVTGLWCLLAIAVLAVAKRLNNKNLGISSLFIFAAAGLKAIFYDLDRHEPVYQIGCFMILGLSLYLGGLILKSIKGEERKPEEKSNLEID